MPQAAPLVRPLHEALRPRAKLWKQTTAALLSLLERESLLTPSCRPFELPKKTRTATKDERQLAENLRRARRAGKLSGEEEAELAAMSANLLMTKRKAVGAEHACIITFIIVTITFIIIIVNIPGSNYHATCMPLPSLMLLALSSLLCC